MICSTVQISGSGVSQLDHGAIVATVPKEEIRKITLSYDPRSRHPFLQFLAGFVLIATGLILLVAEFIIAEGGVVLMQLKSIVLGIPVVPILLWAMVGFGAWLLIGVFRGRYNFRIRTDDGMRKIFFAESADVRDIRSFATRANDELGYAIDLTIMQSMHIPHAGQERHSGADRGQSA